MSQVTSEMFSAFNALQNRFESVESMTGIVERPEAGLHDVIVKDMQIGTDKFRVDNAGQEVDAQTVLFRFQLVNDPTRKVPLEFPGKMFTLPNSIDGLPEKKLKQAEMDLRRLKGHLKGILGLDEDPSNLVVALRDAMKKIKDPTSAVAVQLRCQYDTVQDKTYFKEYVTKSLGR